MPGHLCSPGGSGPQGRQRPVRTKEKSAEAIVPAGKKHEPGRAERTSEGPLTYLWKRR